jgi:phosphatidylserine/phosphatidylglycerophosphate/cardiolipin synthase-like enzyme
VNLNSGSSVLAVLGFFILSSFSSCSSLPGSPYKTSRIPAQSDDNSVTAPAIVNDADPATASATTPATNPATIAAPAAPTPVSTAAPAIDPDPAVAPAVTPTDDSAAAQDPVSFFSTPEDLHHTWLNLIAQAQSSIFMEMFHLTDLQIVAALRAKSPDVKITILLDAVNLEDPKTSDIADSITDGKTNITIYPSSGPPDGFSQTHTKAMIVDGTTALITSINLTNIEKVQRDYGIQTQDPDVIKEMTLVFNTDIQNSKNAQSGDGPVRATPLGIGLGKLIWSPDKSESRLVSLINESIQIPNGPNKYINATVENLGDVEIEKAFSNAAKNGVRVRIIVPQCVLGANGNKNYDLFQYLTDGVQYKAMPHPSSASQPYMHGKMIMLGNGRAYIGSVNFSTHSTHSNRELGIIFTNQTVTHQIDQIFSQQDWPQASDVPDPTDKPSCPSNGSDPTK